jgi:GcrA cell cycle regulator
MSHDYPKHRAESFWNEEREAELTRMADEGLGNSEIARRMGVTRNTIIGKRGRMKLPGASPVPRRPVVRVRGARPRAWGCRRARDDRRVLLRLAPWQPDILKKPA